MAVLKSKSTRNDLGTASVEMAIISLLLLIMTFGGMEWGWLFYRMQEISNVSREAARTAAVPSSTNTTVTDRVSTLMTGYGMGSSSYTLTIVPADISTAPTQTPIRVTISVPYANVGLTGITDFMTPETLTSSATMSREGP